MAKTAMNPKQKRALKRAPPGARASMAANFQRQAAKPAPKAATKKSAPRRKTGLSALLGAGHYDAFHRSPQPIARAVGHATTVRGFNRATKPDFASNAEYQMVVITQSSSRYCAVIGNSWPGSTQENWIASSETHFEITNTGLGTADGPTQCLFGKLSVRLRNTSKAMNAAGSVYVLSLDAGCDLEDLTTTYGLAPGWSNMRKYVMGCPRTRVFSGAELLKSRQWNTHPIDATRALAFHDCGLTKHSKAQFRLDQVDPVFSQIVFVFEKVNDPNDYEFSFANQLYTRYEIGGPLSNAAQPIPTAPINVIDGARKVMEEIGSVGHLAQDAIGAASAFKMAAGL